MKPRVLSFVVFLAVVAASVHLAAADVVGMTVERAQALGPIQLQSKQQPEKLRSATPALWLSYLLGFGSGHFYLHAKNAWSILAGETGCLAGLALGGVLEAAATSPHSYNSMFAGLGQALLGVAAIGISGITLVVLRVLEIVDTYRIVKQQREQGLVASAGVSPTFEATATATGVEVGLRLAVR